MKYKKMQVWSGGSENAKTAKFNTIAFSITFVLLCFTHVFCFLCNMNDDNTIPMKLSDHILFGLFSIGLFGWMSALMLFAAVDSFKNIKLNKMISLYLYDIAEFAKIGSIPNDKFVLFSDESGVILAEKENENESRSFSFGTKYFYEFEKYYDKYTGPKEEILE